jgi:hypothetical protein
MATKTEEPNSLERAVMRSNPKFSLVQARERITHILAVSDLLKSFNLGDLSMDTIRKLDSLRAQSGLKMASLIGLLAEHGEKEILDQIETVKATLLLRAKSGQPRPDETSDDPEERRLARALIAFTTPPGFDEDQPRIRLTKRGRR